MSEQNDKPSISFRKRNVVLVIACAIAAIAILVLFMRDRSGPAAEAAHEDEHSTQEVVLSTEALAAAGVEVEGVTQRAAVGLVRVTGTIEVNQQQSQQATPLVGGRIERVYAALGDPVRAGAVLATISSPQIAQMHGKLHESETNLALAERNLQRVQKAENRVAVLQAKARFDEAEATLKRVRRLIELGAGAGKDLIAAETAYKTAKADYEFQANISLNRELQEAQAAVETARVDVGHIRDEMRALGAPVPEGEKHIHDKDTSLIALRAPVSGIVTERLVNPGAGTEAGKALFTISNLSTVWVIANVPEAQLASIRVGSTAEVRSTAIGPTPISGSVGYINPQLNEETRTAQVRIEVGNPRQQLKAGMFVEVGFQSGSAAGEELMVNSAAVQRVDERTVVFVPKQNEPGHFEVKDVELGGEVDGYRKVLSGVNAGDQVVTKGSFTLKTQLLKGSMEEDEH